MGREVSHGQEACGSISAHQASNYDLLHLPPGSGIHIKNNLNCRVCFGLFRICQVKEGTLYKSKTTEDRINSFFPGLDSGWSNKPSCVPRQLGRWKISLHLPSGRTNCVSECWLSKIRSLCPTCSSDCRNQSSKTLHYLLCGRQKLCSLIKDAVTKRIFWYIHTSFQFWWKSHK